MTLARRVRDVFRRACSGAWGGQPSPRKARHTCPLNHVRLRFEPLEQRTLLAVTLLSEGFEQAFPAQNAWSVGDANSTGKPAYWAEATSKFGGELTHGGLRMGYCAGSGYAGSYANPTYQNSMSACMSKDVNLSGLSSAKLSFWYKIPSIELNNLDHLRAYIDSTVVFDVSAAATSWTQKTVSLNSYVGRVRALKFEFYSDSSGTAEGAYLDDILVSGELANTLPDLTVTSVDGPLTGIAGQAVSVARSIKNNGSGNITGNYDVGLYLSTDATITTGDYPLELQTVTGGLIAGTTSALARTVTLPSSYSGTYYIGAIADPANAIAETSEGNNSRYDATPIVISPETGVATLQNNVPKTNLAGVSGSERFFKLTVPAGATNLKFQTSGGAGDADLYVKFAVQPTISSYDYRPHLGGNNETVTPNSATAGNWYVMIRGASLSYSGVTLTGSYSVGVPDLDDQIVEAHALGELSQNRTFSDAIESGANYGTDVDMYSFIVASAGQVVAIDVDCPLLAGTKLDSYIRLFDTDGNQLSGGFNDNGTGVGEGVGAESYLRYTFNTAGTYYLGISAAGNNSYSAVTGAGDVSGSSGAYALYVSPLNGVQKVEAQPNDVPRPNTAPTVNSPSSIQPFLRRVDGTAIQTGIPTWIVIHGRGDTSTNSAGIGNVATLLGATDPNDQVLVLDWSVGAADNAPADIGLDGAGWIPNVAVWAASVLNSLGITTSNVYLVGHSWGTYVAYEVASRIPGGVQAIVALDPARAGGNIPWYGAIPGSDDSFDDYDETRVNFGQVSRIAWAFYGQGIYGSAQLAGTADEAFAVNYAGATSVDPDSLPRHLAPIRLFENLLGTSGPWQGLFSLNNLRNQTLGPWATNRYAAGSGDDPALSVPSGLPRWLAREGSKTAFEGMFTLSTGSSGDWKTVTVNSFRYIASSTNTEMVLNAQAPQLLTNGGFETGNLYGWTVTAGGSFPRVVTTAASGSSQALHLGDGGSGLGSGNTASIEQTVSIASSATAPTLSLRYRVQSSDGPAYDWMRVYLNGAQIATWSADSGGWQTFTYDLSPYKGKNVTLKISSWTADTFNTVNYFLDDLRIIA